MDKKDIKAEYDRFYRLKPTKWTSDDRNEYARQKIEEYLNGDRVRSVLDIGCGNGHTIAYLKAHWPDAKFYGLDLSEVAIGIARDKFDDVDLRVGFIEDTEYDEKFNCVILLGVAEHFHDIVFSFKKIADLLAPGGFVYMESPNCLAYEGSEQVEGFRRVNFGNHQMEWHLTRQSWVKKLKQAGFVVASSIIGPTPQTEFVFILEKE
jgi:SAM-dependent methyltransferase